MLLVLKEKFAFIKDFPSTNEDKLFAFFNKKKAEESNITVLWMQVIFIE